MEIARMHYLQINPVRLETFNYTKGAARGRRPERTSPTKQSLTKPSSTPLWNYRLYTIPRRCHTLSHGANTDPRSVANKKAGGSYRAALRLPHGAGCWAGSVGLGCALRSAHEPRFASTLLPNSRIGNWLWSARSLTLRFLPQ